MPQAFPDRLTRKANQLYWETDRPAGQLAEELGVSRSKLYAMIEPLEIGRPCEACDGSLVFGSRTDRDAGRARCSECGAAIELPEAEEIQSAEAQPAQTAPSSRNQRPPTTQTEGGAEPPTYTGTRELWVSAAAGLAIGLLAAAWLRRR